MLNKVLKLIKKNKNKIIEAIIKALSKILRK